MALNTNFGKINKQTSTVLLLLVFSFCIGIGLAFFFTIAISVFFINFSGNDLPYAYLLSGVSGVLIWLAYHGLSKRIRFSRLLLASLTFLLISIVFITLTYDKDSGSWLSMFLLVWVAPFLFIKNVCFWGVATRVFNISQGKKLFSVISSGEVISNIVGFFSVPFLIKWVGATGILSIVCIVVLLSIGIAWLLLITNKIAFSSGTVSFKSVPSNESVPGTRDIFFLRALAFSSIAIFVFYCIDYLFLNLAHQQFPEAELLASFMGYFLCGVSVAELFFRSVVFTRIISFYGLKFTLASLPVSLFLSMTLAIGFGLWSESGYLIFSLVALSKLLERSMNNAIHHPGLQLAFQPLPPHARVVVQSRIEGLSGAAGNLFAGAVLLFLQTMNASGNIVFYLVVLCVLFVWIVLASSFFKVYQQKLNETLASKKDAQPLRRSVTSRDIFERALKLNNPVTREVAELLLAEHDRVQRLQAKDNLVRDDAIDRFENSFANARSTDGRLNVLKSFYLANGHRQGVGIFDKLEYPDREFQLSAIKWLYKANYSPLPSELFQVKQRVHKTIEIITWINAAMLDLDGHATHHNMLRALKSERREYFESLYMLLSFAYGHSTVELIKTNLLDKIEDESHMYAMELANNTFDKDILSIAMPLFENLTPEKSIERLSNFFPQQRLSVANRAIDILYKDYAKINLWTKANALKLLEDYLKNENIRNEVKACVFHTDPLISELALHVLSHGDSHEVLNGPAGVKTVSSDISHTLYGKVVSLRDSSLFHLVPENKLIRLARMLEVKRCVPEMLVSMRDRCCILLRGTITFSEGGEHISADNGSCLFINNLYPTNYSDQFVTNTESLLLVGGRESVLDFIFEDPALSKNFLKYLAENASLNTKSFAQ